MKKVLVAFAAMMMMAFSVVPAFAAEDTTAPTDPTASTSATVATESTDSTDSTCPSDNATVKCVNRSRSTVVNSPVAGKTVERQSPCVVANPDKSGTSPKTGADDSLAYALLAASVIGCGVASAVLVKMAKKH